MEFKCFDLYLNVEFSPGHTFCRLCFEIRTMCTFIYGFALAKPILGKHFMLPRKYPPNHNLLYDRNQRQLTDVSRQYSSNLWWVKIVRKCELTFDLHRYFLTDIWKRTNTELTHSKITNIHMNTWVQWNQSPIVFQCRKCAILRNDTQELLCLANNSVTFWHQILHYRERVKWI